MSERPEALKNRKTLIIVTGGPGTGKSVMAERLTDLLGGGIAAVSYDRIKEKNWDRFGFDDEAQKKRLNAWSLEEFYLTVQKKMWEQQTILIEYPFNQSHREKLQELLTEYGYRAVTVYLYTDLRQIYERGCTRDNEGGRHPGHLSKSYHKETDRPEKAAGVLKNYDSYEDFLADVTKKDYDIRLGKRIAVDVHDFSKVDYEAIAREIRQEEKG